MLYDITDVTKLSELLKTEVNKDEFKIKDASITLLKITANI